MKPNYRLSVLIFFLAVAFMATGQKTELKKANSLLNDGEYYLALETFNQAKELGADDKDTKIKIARCYYHLNDIQAAFDLYLELESDLVGEDVYYYASCWHKQGGFEIAIEWYEKAKKEGSNPIQMNELIKACRWANENQVLEPYRVNPAGLLIGGQSFGIQYYKDGVVYSSSDDEESKKIDRQGKAFLNLYYSAIVDGDIQEEKRPFSKNLLFDYHVGAISFTSDYRKMFYTKSVRIKGGNSRIKIFSVEYDGKDWVNETELSLNSNDFDVAYPAVSPDNKFLYFSSNQRDGFGGTDLYRAEIKNNGSFGTPANLGKDVNTFGDERFPFVSRDNKLYFASDGHIGFGGLDIFVADYNGTKMGNVQNLRQPINSTKDDFGYVLDPKDNTRGFLSSNRTGSGITDAIFTIAPLADDKTKLADDKPPVAGLENIPVFTEEKPVEVPVVIPSKEISAFPSVFTSKMTSTFNGGVIEGVNIIIKDSSTGKEIGSGVSDANGNISINIPKEYRNDQQEFEIEISKGTEFESKRMIVHIMEVEDIQKNGLTLTPIFNDVVLDEISKMVIPYRGNQITSEGYLILDKLAGFLLVNPNVVIKLNGHTEARGNVYNNLTTSQFISDKAGEYLISKGVPDENLIPRGYGERYLKNKCKRGVVIVKKSSIWRIVGLKL